MTSTCKIDVVEMASGEDTSGTSEISLASSKRVQKEDAVSSQQSKRIRTTDAVPFKPDPYSRDFMFRNLGVDLCNIDTSVDIMNVMKAVCIACYGRVALRDKVVDLVKVNRWVIGESLAPYIPKELNLSLRDSQDAFIKSVNAVYKDMRLVNNISILDAEKYTRALQKDSKSLIAGKKDLPNSIPWSVDVLDLELCSLALLFLSTLTRPFFSNRARTMLPLTFIVYARRGSVSEAYISKIEKQLLPELCCNITLDADEIQSLYRAYGKYVTEHNAKTLFETWLSKIPEHAVRARVIVQQAARGGLLAYFTILEAMKMFEDFPWSTVNHLTGGEIDQFKKAMALIGDNEYYAYKKNLGDAASSNYRSLAYVSKELLIKIKGKERLFDYQGWTRNPKAKADLDTLINNYQEKV